MPLLETIASGAARAFGLTSFARLLDQYFNRTTLLISANGTNNAANSSFVDYSSDNVSLTKLGNTSPGAFSPFLGNYSVYYNGSSYSQVSQNAAFQFGTGQFTIEFWVNVAPDVNIQSYWTAIASIGGVGYGQNAIAIYLMDSSYNANGGLAVDMNHGGGGLRLTDNVDIRGTGWRHVAVTRDSSNTVRLFLDGVLKQSGTSTLNIDGSGVYGAVIGISDSNSANFFKGHVSNFRTVKGNAVYTSAFTPPSSKLTAITNTSFLSNQSNAWSKDLSSNNLTIFAGGGAPVTSADSPFVTLSSYATTDGASYYFDGSGDSIQLGTNSAQDPAFMSWLNNNQGKVGTIEAWIYPTALANADTTAYEHPSIFNKGHVFWNWGIRGNTTSSGSQVGQFRFYWYDGAQNWINSTVNVKLNEWTHIASVVNGSSVKLYINGVDVTGSHYKNSVLQESLNFTGIYTPANFAQGSEHYMGRVGSNISHSNWQGYISNFRVVAGTQVYTANFTPPTSPLSNISNTRLLLKAENTAIVDATRNNNLETFGDVKISTAVSKFGGSSLVFDGSGDVIFTSDSPLRNIGTGNFTVEGWFYPTTWTVEFYYRRLWYIGSGLGNDFCLNLDTNGTVQYRNNDTVILTSSSVLPLNSWTHVALCRNNGTTSMYFNGVFVGSTGTNNNLSSAASNKLALGNLANSSERQGTFQGYIDDFRVSRLARYTGAFTPPIREFDTQ
jgi:hypothetical protein